MTFSCSCILPVVPGRLLIQIWFLLFIKTYHHPRRPADHLLCNVYCTDSLSYSDLVKSWRGSVAVWGIRSIHVRGPQ